MPIKLNGATSGSVTLEAPAVAGTTTLILPATSGTVVTTTSPSLTTPTMTSPTISSGNLTFSDSTAINSANNLGMRNRIINGDMRIFQRNQIATTTGSYSVDRWRFNMSSTGTVQTTQSQAAPVGFNNSFLFDVVTADTSIAAGDYAQAYQVIEGYNIADLGWGTVDAKSVTLSFWVYSTITGIFCAYLGNGTLTYVSEYTVNAANTWEYKTIIIPGPTTGTWNIDENAGVYVSFCFAAGTTYQTTANSWNVGGFLATANQTNLLASATNSIRITGVQFEVGSVATPFERQIYSNQLAQCQRYYWRFYPGASRRFGSAFNNSTTVAVGLIIFPVPMRTFVSALETSGTATDYGVSHAGAGTVATAVPVYSVGGESSLVANLTVASGLTTGSGSALYAINANAYLGFSAELQ